MTTKDYVAIAKAFADAKEYHGNVAAEKMRQDIAWTLVGIFLDNNPRFDQEMFLKACRISV